MTCKQFARKGITYTSGVYVISDQTIWGHAHSAFDLGLDLYGTCTGRAYELHRAIQSFLLLTPCSKMLYYECTLLQTQLTSYSWIAFGFLVFQSIKLKIISLPWYNCMSLLPARPPPWFSPSMSWHFIGDITMCKLVWYSLFVRPNSR